jgi:hypothetical protein
MKFNCFVPPYFITIILSRSFLAVLLNSSFQNLLVFIFRETIGIILLSKVRW